MGPAVLTLASFCLQKSHECWVSACFRTPRLSLGHPGSFKSAHVLKCMRTQTAPLFNVPRGRREEQVTAWTRFEVTTFGLWIRSLIHWATRAPTLKSDLDTLTLCKHTILTDMYNTCYFYQDETSRSCFISKPMFSQHCIFDFDFWPGDLNLFVNF